MDDLVRTFLATGGVVRDALADPAVATAWDRPSALEGYTVGGLAGHLARGVLTVARYLDDPSPPATGSTAAWSSGTGPQVAGSTDAAGYLVAVLGDHDPVDSDLHRRVRARGGEEAQDGPDALVQRLDATLEVLGERLPATDPERAVTVLQDTVMPLAAYLRTRLVELVVHLDDLAASLGRDRWPAVPAQAVEVVAEVLAVVAVRRVGPWPVVRSLARAERHPGAVRAL
jgi:uncharacterized protein (TIGR03083 family)